MRIRRVDGRQGITITGLEEAVELSDLRPKDDSIDSYLIGLKDQSFTLSGKWESAPEVDIFFERPASVILRSIRFCWVEWYRERWVIDRSQMTQVSQTEFEVLGLVPPRQVLAERWRRVGYWILRRFYP